MTEEEGAPLDIKFQQRFSKNLLSNVVYFVLNIIIGLALVPFFLDTLGPAAYGLVPLATSVTTYVLLIINSFNTTISRFLTLDLQNNDYIKANVTFNTSLFGSLGVILVLAPIIFIIAWYAPVIFNIGDTAALDVFLLFTLVFASALIRAFGSNFMVILFAYNHLEKRNYVNISNLAIQVAVVLILFVIFGPSLPAIGFSYFIAAIFSVIVAYYLSKNTCSFLSISSKYFSKSSLKEIGSASIWITFNDIGFFVRLQISLIIVNLLFGPAAGTEYALTITWSGLLASIGSLITSLFVPMIYSYRAKNDKVGMIIFSATAMRITGLIIALCIGLVCIFSAQLLTLWVGEEYALLAPLMLIVVMPVYFTILEGCAGSIFVSYLRIKIPTFANLITGVLNVVLAIFFASTLSMGLYGVALATAISIFLYSVVFKLTYGAYVVGAPLFTLTRAIIPGFISLLILLLAGLIYTELIPVDSLLSLIVSGGIIAVIYLAVVTRFIFKDSEKKIIRSCLPSYINKIIPKWLF